MTRKLFNAHVDVASKRSIYGVTSVGKGNDDGDVTFLFTPAKGPSIEIGLLALDVSSYPSENTFMIFTKSSDVPEGVNQAVETVASFSAGMEIPELIGTISEQLRGVLDSGSRADPVRIGNFDAEAEDSEGQDLEFGDVDEDDYDDIGFASDDDDLEDLRSRNVKGPSTRTYQISVEVAAKLNRRIRADLRTARFAGFKLGIIHGLKAESQKSILSISIQISNLGLSDEVTQAWDLEPHQYIVLLVRYAAGYKTFDAIIAEPAGLLDISFRIGVCSRYKPSHLEAFAAFADVAKGGDSPTTDDGNDTTPFRSLFISNSLNDFLNNLFISLLKIRKHVGIGWDGAKLFYNDQQGRTHDESPAIRPEYYEESVPPPNSLPKMMQADHLTDTGGVGASFPLIAAQFAMRYLLRCTEFCLVCHDKLSGDFEAMKPYVCSNPLCLYQYMSLGFGPSIEHEIMTQPYVVDLLVSFCYVAAASRRIREYPTGMCLMVPPANPIAPHPVGRGAHLAARVSAPMLPTSTSLLAAVNSPFPNPSLAEPPAATTSELSVDNIEVKYDHSNRETVFKTGQPCPVRNGDWIIVTTVGQFDVEHQSVHYQVADASLHPAIKLSEPVTAATNPFDLMSRAQEAPATPGTTPPATVVDAMVTIYNRNFDDMDDATKAGSIVMLLATLPSIKEIRAYLIQQSSVSEPNLRAWKDRISPAALGLLRWIIASNRSCIVQVDQCPGQESTDPSIRLGQKCSNVTGGWVQFSFAQGAPDKEQRFLSALKNQQSNLVAKYPTIFAFHGSGVANWHSIIRHGLDFTDTLNGRAYGHGVYHALDQSTSTGYTQGGSAMWPQSDLQIRAAMSLNEIVNRPSEFTSKNPYLVVQHVDWIQCRYLMVQTGTATPTSPAGRMADLDGNPVTYAQSPDTIEQDPNYTAKTLAAIPIGIPKNALSVSRAFRTQATEEIVSSQTNKRRKQTVATSKLSRTETAISEDEDPEDINFLFSEDESNAKRGPGGLAILKPAKAKASGKTDFIPGSLDQSELPMLDPPAYATTTATMRLNRELQTILKVQETTPLHELGWYINAELVNNVYQWIVELHSFEASLPLAKDMKTAGVTSIVLEIRFGKDYPHSPPFVRVIKPRFLPFIQGGGGHVTGGGAMCMELLTNSGWSAASSIEGVLLQVRMAIMNLEPKPARLEKHLSGKQRVYGTHEAMQAYIRACATHGWEVPKDFHEFREGTSG